MPQLCSSRRVQALLLRQGKQGMVQASRQDLEGCLTACELEQKHPQTRPGGHYGSWTSGPPLQHC